MTVETTPPMSADSRHEIAFVDTSIAGYETLLAALQPGVEVVLIDAAYDGLAQIATALAGRSGIDALHILSHGSEGTLKLGSATITSGNLDAHAGELAAIKAALGADADILLYGCDVGAGSAGDAFVSRFANLTGADIAASTDVTGAAELGGNWVLENQFGTIQAANPFHGAVAGSYSGLLTALVANISSAIYDASTGTLTVTGTDMTPGGTIDVSTLKLTGQGSARYTLTSSNVTASSATEFTVTLNAADQMVVNGLLNKNGTTAVSSTTYNLSADAGWEVTTGAPAAATNGVTVSNVQAPSISSASYDASTHVLTVTGSHLVSVSGSDITVSKLTLTGEGGATYTLTGAGVEITSATSFSVPLSGADLAAVEQMFNKNGTSSTGGTAYNLAAGDDWNSVITGGDISDGSTTVTVSSVPVPDITAVTYNGASGTLAVTGTGFTVLSGSANDIVTSKLTITGEGGATYTLTGSSVEITSGTSFTIVLDSTDQAGVNALLNKAGASSTGGTSYNLAAANGWAAGAGAVSTTDASNGITVSNPVDLVAPTVTGVSVPINGTHKIGVNLNFTVTFSENVTLTGSGSTLDLTIGSTPQSAAFLSSTGNTITYRYTVQAGDLDTDGITIGGLTLGGHTIRDAAGNDAVLTLNGVGATGNVRVDGVAPVVTGTVSVPADDTYVIGSTLTFIVAFDTIVNFSGNASTLGLNIGGVARTANVTGVASSTITYEYIVQAGDSDADGIAITGIALNGGTIRDAAGNDANLTLAGHLPSLTGVLVDAAPPAVSGNITVPANGAYRAGDELSFTVTFNKNVTVAGTDSVLGLTIGNSAREAVFASKTGNTITYTYTVQAGETDADGIVVGAITPNTTTIKDAAGDDASLTLVGHVPATTGILVDTTAPVVSSVTVPSAATYVAGQYLEFTVNFAENVSVTGSDSTLALTIGSTARSASFYSGSGSTVIYRYTVQAGDVDADGITVGSLTLGASTIRDAAGNNAVLTLNSVGATTHVLVDGTVPVISGNIAVPGNGTYVAGQTLSFTLTFDENVTVTGTDSTLALIIGGTARSATFDSKTANSITYLYTVQAGDNDADGIAVGAIALGATTIRDAAGNNASLSLTGHLPALAGVRVDTAAPVFSGATVDGATLVISYSDASQLDAAHAPAGGDFSVTIGGASVAVTAVAVNAAAKTVTLTLATAAASGQAVTVAYTDPTVGNDSHAIQDAAGNDAVSLAPTAATNTTAAPSTGNPSTSISVVDGVSVVSSSAVRSDGTVVQVMNVPVVTAGRVDQGGNADAADIPLVKDASGKVLLALQVPVGYGLETSGTGQTKLAANSLNDLIREIKDHTTSGSQEQNQLIGGGTSFVDAIGTGTQLLVQTIVTYGGGNAAPLVISGQPQAQGQPQTALVIDTRAQQGAHIELQNVEFVTIIGNATVTGGSGAQHVWGDGASQNIFLGEGDDVLHGGGGDDIIGSAGGNDRIYGDEGDDLIFGGEGNDYLDGGTGHDIARFSGRSADYSLRFKNGELVMTDKVGTDGIDTVVAVETLRFTGGQGSGTEAVVARLYEGLLHRAANAAELSYWRDLHDSGVTMESVASSILRSPEATQLQNASSDAAFVDSLYQNVLGRKAAASETAWWLARLAEGTDRASVAMGFINSAEKLSSTQELDFNHSDVAVLARLYHATFGRAADEAGMNFWLGMRESGYSFSNIANGFLASAEAQAVFQQGDDAAFVNRLYRTALERDPTAAEKALLVDQLAHGVLDRGDALLSVAESTESVVLVGIVNTSLSFTM